MRKALLLLAAVAALSLSNCSALAQARPQKSPLKKWHVAPQDPVNPDERIFSIEGEYYGGFTPTVLSHKPYFQMYCSKEHLEDGMLDTGFTVDAEADSDGTDDEYSTVTEKLKWNDGFSDGWDYEASYESPTTLGFSFEATEDLFSDEKYGGGYKRWSRPANTVLIEAVEWPSRQKVIIVFHPPSFAGSEQMLEACGFIKADEAKDLEAADTNKTAALARKGNKQ